VEVKGNCCFINVVQVHWVCWSAISTEPMWTSSAKRTKRRSEECYCNCGNLAVRRSVLWTPSHPTSRIWCEVC